jgi:hypothetical protein
MDYVSFISNEDFYNSVKKVTVSAESKVNSFYIYKNTIDPFSMVFDTMIQGISFEDWLSQERARQLQKSLQNNVGIFHQNLIGNLPGCESMKRGKVLDIVSEGKCIVAEVKNKFNTIKGVDKIHTYDRLKNKIEQPKYKGFTGYLVEIIPEKGSRYDELFTPPDNEKKEKRPKNEYIRRIDGYSFYALVTDVPDALEQVYQALPRVISDVLDLPPEFTQRIYDDERVSDLFAKAYHTDK